MNFKLRNDLVGNSERIFEIAESYFGKPKNKSCRWGDPHKGPIYVCDWQTEWWLNINYIDGEESIDINFNLGWGLVPRSEYNNEKIRSFMRSVKKPWAEWAENDIMSSPIWINMFADDGENMTKNMNSAMAMYSYRNPEDEEVKKYFKKSRKT
jgi:hypothetical protein